MKKTVLFKTVLAALLLLLPSFRSFAYDFEVDGMYYEMTSSDELTVALTSGDIKYTGDVVIHSSVEYEGTTYSVTSIGEYAFYYCSSLTSIVIPNSVTSIGDYAFDNCTGLISILIPNSVTSIEDNTFEDCSSLTSVEIPNSVTSIGANAFLRCTSLISIVIPGSVTSIERGAFNSCENLISVEIQNGVENIGWHAFYKCTSLISIYIPTSVTSIGDDIYCVFAGCTSLTKIEVAEDNGYFCSEDGILFSKDKTQLLQYPAGLTETSYNIPSTVTVIKGEAFWECSKLTSINLPSSVTSIGDYAFYNSSNLSHITSLNPEPPVCDSGAFNGVDKMLCLLYVPVGTKEAYANADAWKDFYYIEEIEDTGKNTESNVFEVDGIYYEITSSESLTVEVTASNSSSEYTGDVIIPSSVEYNGTTYSVTSIGENAFNNCYNLTSIEIPNSVTSIGEDAFYQCTSLTSVTIGSSVTSIGDGAFSCCLSLTEINIPDGVTEIGKGTFGECSSLTSVTMGTGVTEIGEQAFFYCESLTSINLPYGVTSIGDQAFYGCSSLTEINIPDDVTEIGKGAFGDCSNLTSIIIPDNVTSIGMSAFYNCTSLTSATIGSGVTSIGDYAFQSCTNLTEINSKNPTPPNVESSYAFYKVDKQKCVLNVPIDSKALYASADYWSEFYNINEVNFSSGIGNIIFGGDVKEIERYSLDGTKIDTPHRGINIVKYSDGTTRKVRVK